MESPENKASVTQPLVEKYNLGNGDGFFVQEITGSYAWALHIGAKNLVGIPKKVDVTICYSNKSDGTIESFAETTKKVNISADGVYIIEDFYFAPKFMGIKIYTKETIGELELILTLSREL